MHVRTLAAALLMAMLAMLPMPARAQTPAPTTPLCGRIPTPPATWDHVVWIWFENHSFGSIVGAPHIHKRLIPECGLATNYHSLAHPSLPNYIAATSGLSVGALGPLRDDCNATGDCHSDANSIFALAPSWGAYEESMPRPCRHTFVWPYAASHNPAVYYRTLTDCGALDVNLRELKPALDADALPAFVYIGPNMCDSMHSCSVTTGDAWLWRMIRRLTSSPVYRNGRMAIFVTFDEGNDDDHVATLVISPSTRPHTRSGHYFNHYSLLRTTEEMLGIDRLLGEARRAPSMRSAFNL